MKISKEMQLRILDKMRENISENERVMYGIEVYNPHKEEWINSPDTLNFNVDKYRIKPQPITINGLEIPKPLGGEFQELARDTVLYIPSAFGNWNIGRTVADLCSNYFPQGTLIYKTEEEAIEASKLLFGIED